MTVPTARGRTWNMEGIGGDEIRKAFRQINTARVDTATIDLQAVLQERTQNATVADPEYQDMEKKKYVMLGSLAGLLDVDPPQLNETTSFQIYREGLRANKLFAELQELDDLLARRKTLRKTLRHKHGSLQKQQMSDESQKALKATKQHSKGLSGTGRGRQPERMRELAKQGTSTPGGQIDTSEDAAISALDIEQIAEEGDGQPDIDAEAIEESLDHTREEPPHWSKLSDDVVIHTTARNDDASTAEGRLKFIKTFITLSSVSVSNLKCMLCALDPTAANPDKIYDRYKLDMHLKSGYHDRAMQLVRAVSNSAIDKKVTCSLCGKVTAPNKFTGHLESEHSEQL